jgi:hypothetical protein
LPEPLEINVDYIFALKANIESINKKSDQQGGFEYTHKAKLLTAEIAKKDGVRLKVVAKGSHSQKMRHYIEALGEEEGLDGQEYYDLYMPKIRHYLPEIINWINKRENGKI